MNVRIWRYGRFAITGIAAAAVMIGGSVTGARATPFLHLLSGAQSASISGSGATVQYSNPDFNGWNIWITYGVSEAPFVQPFGLEIANMSVACTQSAGCSGNPLTIEVSDTGFTQIARSGLGTFYSNTGYGTTTQNAYVDTADALFGTPANGLIGTITLTNTAAQSLPDNPSFAVGPSPYSLTLVDTFAPGAGNSYSSDGNIGVPEPASLLLFATGLFGLGALGRRRRRVRTGSAAADAAAEL